jgi:dephospho-CoA kinase
VANRGTAPPRADTRPLVIGLTGGIGSGKTTAAGLFREAGVPIIDADEIAHALVAPGTAGLAAIIGTFGNGFLQEDGRLDRGKLRKLAFSDPRRRRQLEAILHPLIRQEINKQINETRASYCIVVIPLLLETRQTDLVDRILVIDAPPQTQVHRIVARDNLPADDIRAIMDAQTGREARLAAANDVILNEGSREELATRVRTLHEKYLEMSQQR